MEFKNESGYEFTDISSEKYREYVFDNMTIWLLNPLKLAVSESGHRIFTSDCISHYIPKGWQHLFWEVKDGMPNFVK